MIQRSPAIDELDLKLLDLLMKDGRATWKSLSGEIGLSAPSTTERVKGLERDGVITGYEARLNPEAVGYSLLAYISVRASVAFDPPEFFERVNGVPQIQECHLLTGEFDYLLKVRCTGSDQLYDVLQVVQTWPGVGTTRSSIVLKTTKETQAVPLDGARSRAAPVG